MGDFNISSSTVSLRLYLIYFINLIIKGDYNGNLNNTQIFLDFITILFLNATYPGENSKLLVTRMLSK